MKQPKWIAKEIRKTKKALDEMGALLEGLK